MPRKSPWKGKEITYFDRKRNAHYEISYSQMRMLSWGITLLVILNIIWIALFVALMLWLGGGDFFSKAMQAFEVVIRRFG